MEDDVLFAALYPALRRFAAVVRPPGVDPDDLVQEAVARTLARSTLSELDDAGTYVRTVITRLASNHRRDTTRRTAILDRWGPRPLPAVDDQPIEVADLLQELPSVMRAVLYLRIIEEMPYSEIADVVGISEDAARARYSRGLRQLRVSDVEMEEELLR